MNENSVPPGGDELVRRVLNFLEQRRLEEVKDFHAAADGGVLTVQGRVASAPQKETCLACCRRVAGVIRVIDELDVLDELEVRDQAEEDPEFPISIPFVAAT